MGEFEDKLNSILSNQEAMGQIMALAQSLGGSKQPAPSEEEQPAQEQPAPPPESASIPGLDPRLMQMGMRLLQEYNRTDDRNAALLAALRPFVKEERYAKVDRAVQIAKLSRVIRVLLDLLKENGGNSHV